MIIFERESGCSYRFQKLPTTYQESSNFHNLRKNTMSEDIFPGSLASMKMKKLFFTEMSRHLEQLLEIDNLLRNGERQTAGRIAAVLEVTERRCVAI